MIPRSVVVAVLLAGCPSLQGRIEEERALSALTGRELHASFASGDGSYDVQLVLAYAHAEDECFKLPEAAYGESGGARLTEKGGYWAKGGGCVNPWFEGVSLPLPAPGDGTMRVVDGDFEVSMTGESLFTSRTAALRPPATALKPGEKVYLDLLPASDGVSEITVWYYLDGGPVDANGYPIPAFHLTSNLYDSLPNVLHDAGGWYFVVPEVASGTGRMSVWTLGPINVVSSTNVDLAEIEGSFIRRFTTSSVP